MPPITSDQVRATALQAVSDVPEVAASHALQAGREKMYSRLGTGAFLMDLPAGMAVDRIAGEKGAYQLGAWNRFSRPLLNMDERAGRVARDAVPGFLKGMFQGVEEIPLAGQTAEGLPVKAMRPVARLSEPLMKMRRVAVPLLASGAFFKWREHQQEERETRDLINQLLSEQQLEVTAMPHTTGHQKTAAEVLEDKVVQSADLLKRAGARIRDLDGSNTALLEKVAGYEIRVGAEKLAWDMVERGHCDPYADRSEFEVKVAAIIQKGIAKVADAMDMNIAMDQLSLGDPKVASSGDIDPLTAFVYGVD
jgi:hypothetical protein